MLLPAYSPDEPLIPGVLPPAYGFSATSGLLPAYGVAPSLDLDFTNPNIPLNGLITFTRASSATYFDSSGVMQTATSGQPRCNARQDHNPSTLEPLGFLIEEQRTNICLQSQDLATTWGASNGAQVAVNAVAAPDGTTTADRMYGPAVASGFVAKTQSITVAASTAYTLSFFCKAGTIDRITYRFSTDTGVFAGYDGFNLTSGAAGNAIGSPTSATITQLTNGWYRVSVTASMAAGFTSTSVQIYLANGGSYANNCDDTDDVYVWGAQLEAGAFATSYIATTTEAATRLADSALITGTNFSSFWNQRAMTIIAIGDMAAPAVAAHGPYRIDDETDNERIMLRDSGAGLLGFVIVDGGVTQANLATGNTITANTVFKHAAAYAANDVATAYNGGNALADSSATLPTVTRLLLGVGGTTTSYINGHLQRWTGYRTRLSPNAALDALTT